MPKCRICGATCNEHELRGVELGGGCVDCSGSPRCRRCGHSRSNHRGTFGGGTSGCRVEIHLDDGSLGTGRCGCPGYATKPDSADVGVVDVRVPALRPPKS